MIDVQGIHAYSSTFQARGAAAVERFRHDRKKRDKPQTNFGKGAVTTRQPVDPASHPYPVQKARMREMVEAANRLAAHSDARVDEIRNGGK